jgi:hypothetical protein
LCKVMDQTPASFLRHLRFGLAISMLRSVASLRVARFTYRKDWPHRRVVLMQSSDREDGIFCHSSTPMSKDL